MIAYIAIGLAVWLGASALILLWMHCATRDFDEFDVLGEAGNRSRDGWVPK